MPCHIKPTRAFLCSWDVFILTCPLVWPHFLYFHNFVSAPALIRILLNCVNMSKVGIKNECFWCFSCGGISHFKVSNLIKRPQQRLWEILDMLAKRTNLHQPKCNKNLHHPKKNKTNHTKIKSPFTISSHLSIWALVTILNVLLIIGAF